MSKIDLTKLQSFFLSKREYSEWNTDIKGLKIREVKYATI